MQEDRLSNVLEKAKQYRIVLTTLGAAAAEGPGTQAHTQKVVHM